MSLLPHQYSPRLLIEVFAVGSVYEVGFGNEMAQLCPLSCVCLAGDVY